MTLLHQGLRQITPDAPRMDILGMRALAKGLRKADIESPKGDKLYNITMLGDLIGNGLYYSAIAIGDDSSSIWLRGSILGLLAGIGGVALPGPMGLGSRPSSRTRATQLLTVLLYLKGGLVTALVYRFFRQGAQE